MGMHSPPRRSRRLPRPAISARLHSKWLSSRFDTPFQASQQYKLTIVVFLRVLEYYAGILFLTTNRVGDFDEAFGSRIHISLHYPPLSQKSTERIFKLNLRLIRERFDDRDRKIVIEEKEILHFASEYWQQNKKKRWNGRQIRNACQTALALAEFTAQGGSHWTVKNAGAEVRLTVAEFNTVSKAYLEFLKYLKAVHGVEAERRAMDIGIRAREHSKVEGQEGDDEDETQDENEDEDTDDDDNRTDGENFQIKPEAVTEGSGEQGSSNSAILTPPKPSPPAQPSSQAVPQAENPAASQPPFPTGMPANIPGGNMFNPFLFPHFYSQAMGAGYQPSANPQQLAQFNQAMLQAMASGQFPMGGLTPQTMAPGGSHDGVHPPEPPKQ